MKILVGAMSLAVVLFADSAQPLAALTDLESARSSRQAAPGRIAFTRMREDVDRAGSDYRLHAEIWMMNRDGSDPVRLTHNTTDDLGAVWSPDGKTIAFYGVQFAPNAAGQLVAGTPQIFLIDVGTRAQRPLLNDLGEPVRGRFPSWSPDGRQIAFDTSGPTSNIAIINLDGTGSKQITNEPTSRSTRPDWSPDGRKLAFARGSVGNEQLYVMNVDGSDLIRVTDPGSGGHSQAPDWSPDGRRIVFQSNRDSRDTGRNQQIYVMNADGSDQRRLTNYAGADVDPAWSPDGLLIAFERASAPRNIDQVFVMSADGGQATPLTRLPSANGHPGWEVARK